MDDYSVVHEGYNRGDGTYTAYCNRCGRSFAGNADREQGERRVTDHLSDVHHVEVTTHA